LSCLVIVGSYSHIPSYWALCAFAAGSGLS